MRPVRHFRPARLVRSSRPHRFPRGELAADDRSLLDTWLAEVQRHPLLSQEEEVALARSFRQRGDTKARTRLVAGRSAAGHALPRQLYCADLTSMLS